MLAMPEIHHIKHLREKKGLSLSEIVRRTGFNWRTVKKYADGDISVRQKIKRKRGMMEEEGYGQIIDDWLEEDAKLPRKQRRTSKKMYEQLKQEHGFKGSYRTVCAYVQKRRPQLKLEKERRYERLEHPPGEAQVDFGTMSVVTKEGKEEDRSILILSFPYSNAAYAYLHCRRKTANVFFTGSLSCFAKPEASRENCASTIWRRRWFRFEKEANVNILKHLSDSGFIMGLTYRRAIRIADTKKGMSNGKFTILVNTALSLLR